MSKGNNQDQPKNAQEPPKNGSKQKNSKLIAFISFIIVILLIISIIFIPKLITTNKAMNQMHSSFSESYTLAKRKDHNKALTNSPNKKEDNIFTAESQISKDNPKLIIFYKVNCPFCEASHSTIIKSIKSLKENNPNIDFHKNMGFVDVDSELGTKLVKKFGIKHAATMTLINKNGTYENYSQAYKKSNKFIANSESIVSTFAKFNNEIKIAN